MWLEMVHDASVVVIPAHLTEFARDRVVPEDWVSRQRAWHVQSTWLARGMSWNAYLREEGICLWMELFQNRSDVETVYKKRCAAGTIGMGEKMKKL